MAIFSAGRKQEKLVWERWVIDIASDGKTVHLPSVASVLPAILLCLATWPQKALYMIDGKWSLRLTCEMKNQI
jgi:hypothetical protein